MTAWHLAAGFPEHVTRAAILNAPHPATLRAYARRHPGQLLKSWYVGFFQLPRWLAFQKLQRLAQGAAIVRRELAGQ